MNDSIYKDDVFSHIEDDIEKIRKKTGMYIPYTGSAGARHLIQELIDNVLDEIYNPDSPAKSCNIILNTDDNKISVEDDGRGIPFDKVELICTKIQSGSKFDRDNGDNSAGENGVGLTAVNALSKYLKFTIYRQTSENSCSVGIFEFSKGKLLNKNFKSVNKIKHGTVIEMIPDDSILGECKIDSSELLSYLSKLSYIIGDIPLKLSIIKDGEIIKHKFNYHKLSDYIHELTDNITIQPIELSKTLKGDIKQIDVVFSYDDNKNTEIVDSFVNRINTIEGGQHVIAARVAIGGVLCKLANETLSETEKKKFEITYDDCRTGLVMVVNLSCKFPGFVGQQKEKCGNKDLFIPIRTAVSGLLYDYLKREPDKLKRIINYLKRVAKSRITTNKIKKSDLAGIDSFKANKMANFSDATESSKQNELYLIEGLSAKGSIMKARDPRFQAALAFKGLVANSIGLTPAQIMQNPEYATLIRASGLGIGSNFNLYNSKYKRYIISTDADIDGWKIASGLAVFFLYHWPEVVKAGMLYVAQTPLYMIEKSPGVYDYITTKTKLFEEKIKGYIKFTSLRYNGHILTDQEYYNLLKLNKNYEDILKELYTHEFIHPDILEYILGHKDRKDFNKRFPEIKVENNIISGSYKGVYQFMIYDDIFKEKSQRLKEEINKNYSIYFDFKDEDNWINDCSLGFILRKLKDYDLKIKSRWKGLGSIPAEVFWDVVMNPKKRTLVQLTIEDIEKDMKIMNILHGSDPSKRRSLLSEYKLDKDDIDS